ncbi:MAG: TetR/AcrR family transcriptional regulator [Acidimicrobiales bacterium]
MSRARAGAALLPSELSESQRARRDRIIDAALALSRRRAFEQIQMKDVAEASGVALGTMYQYFSSKDHLFAEALVHWGELLPDNLRSRPLQGDDPAQRITEVLHRAVRAFQQQPNLAKLVTALSVSSDPFAVEAIARLDQSTGAVFRAALVGLDEPTAASMVRIIYHVMAGTLRLWSAGRMSIVDVYSSIDETVDLLFRSQVPGEES